jgi:hypothetical protein
MQALRRIDLKNKAGEARPPDLNPAVLVVSSPSVVLSRLRSGLSTHLCGPSFKCQGAFPAERRVPPSWIIELIEILEYSPFRLASCFPTIAPDELRLDGFEEREEVQERPQWGVSPTQDHAIVIAITFAAHRHFEAELFQAFW